MEISKIEMFSSPEFGQIRIIKEGDKYLFAGKDAADALGYANSRAALTRHCKGVTKRDTLTEGGTQTLSFIPEGDLYRLIVHSKLPSAVRFEHWVFDEVIPFIRKHECYATDALLERVAADPHFVQSLIADLAEEHQARIDMECTLEAVAPKVEYFNSFIDPSDCTNIRVTAKELGIPERKFTKFLVDAGYMYRCEAGYLLPYAKHSANGLFIVRDYYYGRNHKTYFSLITPRGKLLIKRRLDRIEKQML